MQAFVPSYLEMSLESFSKQQERFRTQFGAMAPNATMGAAGLSAYEDQIRQNMVLFDRAMKMFSPFGFPQGGAPAAGGEPAQPGETAPAAAAEGEALDELKKQLAAMQAQLEKLASKG